MKTINLSIIAALVAIIPSAYSDTVVKWNGTDIVTTNQSLNLTSYSDTNRTRVFNQTTTPLSPQTSYNAQPFYGIIQNNSGTTAQDFSSARVENASPDRTLIVGQGGIANEGPARSVAGLIYFQKEDFLNYQSGDTYQFDANSKLTLNISSLNAGGGTGSSRVVRFAILNDGQWYLSWTYQSSTTLWTLDNLADQRWAEYTADTSLLPPSSFTSGDYTTRDFQNIQAVGFYFLNSFSANASAAGSVSFGFNNFEASLAAIPEPSTMALAMLAGIGLLAGRRILRR